MTQYRYALVTPVRWETENIVEWLVYHRSIGFEHVYLYCNDDDAMELHDRLCVFLSQADPFITFVHFPFQGLQWEMYLHWFRHYADETIWAAFLDADEFLTLPDLDNIDRFMRTQPEACDAIHFHWIYYGTNGYLTRPPGSVLRQYTRRARDVSFETKTMVQAARISPDSLRPQQLPFWHVWDERHRNGLRCFTSRGTPMPVGFDRRAFARDHDGEIKATAFVAHFALRSEADFLRRRSRGTGGQFYGQAMWANTMEAGKAQGYLEHTNATEDFYLKRYWERLVGIAQATRTVPPAPGLNLAIGRPCRQSSTGPWSINPDAERDAAGAVSGRVTGRPTFHTGEQFAPWWQVDLGMLRLVQQVRVFNRVDDPGVAARLRALVMQQSDDGLNWTALHQREPDGPFGGADGNPLIWTAAEPVRLRFLRLTVEAHLSFGLDQIEVFGPVEPSVSILSVHAEGASADVVAAQRAILGKFAPARFTIEQATAAIPAAAFAEFMARTNADVVVLLDVGCIPLHAGALPDLVAHAAQDELVGCSEADGAEPQPGRFCLALSRRLWHAVGGPAAISAKTPDLGVALAALCAAHGAPVRPIAPTAPAMDYGESFRYEAKLEDEERRAEFLNGCRLLSASASHEERRLVL